MRDERPLSAVPLPVFAVLLAALALHIAIQWAQPRPVARAEALEAAPPVTVLRAAALGEPVAMAQLTALYLHPVAGAHHRPRPARPVSAVAGLPGLSASTRPRPPASDE